jgi:hypothetical protein
VLREISGPAEISRDPSVGGFGFDAFEGGVEPVGCGARAGNPVDLYLVDVAADDDCRDRVREPVLKIQRGRVGGMRGDADVGDDVVDEGNGDSMEDGRPPYCPSALYWPSA